MRKTAIAGIAFIVTFMSFNSFASPAAKKKWIIIGGSIGMLSPRENVKIYLEASLNDRTKDMSINMLDNTHAACKASKPSKQKENITIKINGKFVKVISKCVNGRHFILPRTEAGKRYLNSAVASGQGIVIDTGFSSRLHYPGTDLKALRDKFLSVENARKNEG